MDTTLEILLGTAVGIGFLHTLIGIDHALPFVVLGQAQGWSLRKTLTITGLCGLGHVLSSVMLGVLGISLGLAVVQLEWIEGTRGSLAAWLLIFFGLSYAGWSLARRRRLQRHVHKHADGSVHVHEHAGQHGHNRGIRNLNAPGGTGPHTLTAWSLFIIFTLGPCEPLVPLLLIPAGDLGAMPVALVAGAFGVTTITTMLALVALGYFGLKLPRLRRLEAHTHTLAGLTIAGSGLAIHLLGI